MKYKGKQGNSYLFECEGEELEAIIEVPVDEFFSIKYRSVIVWETFDVLTEDNYQRPYKDIQTAVSMMQILIDKGEV